VWHLLVVLRVATRSRRQRSELDRGCSICATSDAHTLCILMYFPFCRLRASSCTMSYCMYLIPFQFCILIPACGTSFVRTCIFFQCILYLLFMYINVFSLPRHISPLCSYSCSVLYFFSAVYSFSEYMLYLLDLSLTETVKQTYGQWLVYGEFNTLGSVSRS
jgi:hypothetical protein